MVFEYITALSSVMTVLGILIAILYGRKWLDLRIKESSSPESVPSFGGYIVLNIPEKEKSYFHDLLKGFEEYAGIKGYKIKFSIDNSINDKIGFKFTVGDAGLDVSEEKVKDDLREFINKVEKGDDLDDLPVDHFSPSQQALLNTMKNRINFLHVSYKTQRRATELYESVLDRLALAHTGFNPQQNFYLQGGGTMSDKRNTSINSQGVVQGEDIKTIDIDIDQSIKIGRSFNEKKSQVEKVRQLMDSLSNSTELNDSEREEATKNLRKVKEELEDEEKPDSSRIKKWMDRAKDFLKIAKEGQGLYESAKETFESFDLPF